MSRVLSWVSAERLLPFACIAAALMLGASELMTAFEFTPPGREPLASQDNGDRHGNAMFVIAVFAIAATFIAVTAASKPAAIGVGTMGVIALLVFLLVDLPDAGQVGTLDDARQSFFDAEAVPQAGFWLELVGALALALSGIALATLTAEQLSSLRRDRGGDEPRRLDEAEQPPSTAQDPASSAQPEAAKSKPG